MMKHQPASQAVRPGHIEEHQQASDEQQQSEDEWMSDDEWMIGDQMQNDEANDLCGQASQPASQALDEQQQSYEDRKCQFKWAVYKFMLHEKQYMKTNYFKFEELKNSIFHSNFSEDHLKYWIKNTT